MCYDISILSPKETLTTRFHASFLTDEKYSPYYHVSAFSIPQIPVITNEDPDHFHLYHWGLVPFWVKNQDQLQGIREKTMNARAESIYEKPAYRHAAQQRHCLVIADGFFEWQHVHGNAYPYYIQLVDQQPFAMAGLWERWKDNSTNLDYHSFSIITCEANPLLAKIHNKKKRMPVILPKDKERQWLDVSLSADEAQTLLVPYDDQELKAHTISKLISHKQNNTNVPQVIQQFHYQELDSKESQSTLF